MKSALKIRYPLYAKIMFWFFLNVIFLCAVFFILARGQLHFWMDALISGPAGGRLNEVAQLIEQEFRDAPLQEWNGVLRHCSDAYHVQFFAFRADGQQLAGETVALPPEIRERISERRGVNLPPPSRENGDQQDRFNPPRDEMHRPPMGLPQRMMIHTSGPSRYWVLTRLFLPSSEGPRHPMPIILVAKSESINGSGLFFDLRSWALGGVLVVIVSALFWFPLVRGITISVSRMTRATERIAEGRFDVRTQVRRKDEIGALSDAIDRMAERLAGFVAGQKRFLGDIAHELCSPIARIQVALGILEQRGDEKQKVYLDDLREEVEHMSRLVNELLSFSKASLGGGKTKLQAVALRPLVEKAVDRECGKNGRPEIGIEIANDARAMADPELLLRAVGNILRNSIRYASDGGPVTISSLSEKENVKLLIEDCGPGIPAEALPKVFDPFYRVDTSRARETGGVGLGLSIVKTCVESCGGTVRCENRAPHGLRVIVTLASTENRSQPLCCAR